ncbi:FIST signal transduction protein [Undibacterium rugosum]|uniref:FIST C-terminal domain-containing protein n=1 Tax=Undibacterium rugosum TaxID=2762291 RepID=A0A923I181_9BURK|nr:FIST N-terminal domain-containing protein [Undibacterium rugosum]MBC3934617.1 FIST C-terminal domain-containing protein [Undibacterium rugosum]MBR7777231.1 FIST C-terminal domain-containing protein [Undibacterium rugosum]
MKIAQEILYGTPGTEWKLDAVSAISPQLVLVFASISHFENPDFLAHLRRLLPDAQLLGCSTAGEISAQGVSTQTVVVTGIRFNSAQFQIVSATLSGMEYSEQAGRTLAAQLSRDGLRAVSVFGQGVGINGSALIDGIVAELGQALPVTGGLAGDNGSFSRTYTLGPAGVSDNQVVALGLYGKNLTFTHGSYGGWRPFGPVRKVTRCEDNILYELDGAPALDIYKKYLGDYAADLPGSGLLFPFEMLSHLRESLGQIRTILGINEQDGSLILAGSINPDGYLRLMHAQTNELVDGAETAASAALPKDAPETGQALAMLVSCVGRKLVMGGRVDEEVEVVQDLMGSQTVICGFYSNGEICPGYQLQVCSLHNQTMTISYMAEDM